MALLHFPFPTYRLLNRALYVKNVTFPENGEKSCFHVNSTLLFWVFMGLITFDIRNIDSKLQVPYFICFPKNL